MYVMDNQNEFKPKYPIKEMAVRYLLSELNINKKFARKQQVSWADLKKHIFEIIKEISKKSLFKYEDRAKSDYNLLEGYEDNYSLCICPTQNNEILNFKLLSSDEKRILEDNVDERNNVGNPFITTFYMGLISHKNAVIFQEGAEKPIWDYTGDILEQDRHKF